MTTPARATLRQPFRGDRPGITFYALFPRGAWHGDDFPLECFPALAQAGDFTMHGQDWEIKLWDLTFEEFPDSESWRTGVHRTYDWIFASGGVVAWIGDGTGYAAPPQLFDAKRMANSVFEGRSADGIRVGALELDAPAVYLDGAGLRVLRTASGGLAMAD
ncbi:hypothetical protein OHA21_33240 [Actinoplanes sp. NBC_00393]|uniref:hypothetical protein n=1 Tax=Actinoplanes sp. NBC_00393 TaxID=2975953 RepID=UPI002E1E5242